MSLHLLRGASQGGFGVETGSIAYRLRSKQIEMKKEGVRDSLATTGSI
jgi:hypothetical protein